MSSSVQSSPSGPRFLSHLSRTLPHPDPKERLHSGQVYFMTTCRWPAEFPITPDEIRIFENLYLPSPKKLLGPAGNHIQTQRNVSIVDRCTLWRSADDLQKQPSVTSDLHLGGSVIFGNVRELSEICECSSGKFSLRAVRLSSEAFGNSRKFLNRLLSSIHRICDGQSKICEDFGSFRYSSELLGNSSSGYLQVQGSSLVIERMGFRTFGFHRKWSEILQVVIKYTRPLWNLWMWQGSW